MSRMATKALERASKRPRSALRGPVQDAQQQQQEPPKASFDFTQLFDSLAPDEGAAFPAIAWDFKNALSDSAASGMDHHNAPCGWASMSMRLDMATEEAHQSFKRSKLRSSPRRASTGLVRSMKFSGPAMLPLYNQEDDLASLIAESTPTTSPASTPTSRYSRSSALDASDSSIGLSFSSHHRRASC